MEKNSIYEYLDFRGYLKDYYTLKKKANKKFSQRYFAQKIGVKSTGFFSEIINNKRNLSNNNIIHFCKVINFNQEEAQYFDNLVRFNQAKTIVEKNHWFKKLMTCKKVDISKINKYEYQYFSKWHHAVIRELLYFIKFKGDFQALANAIIPPIKIEEAKASIKLLEKLGFVEKKKDGVYKSKDTVLSTGDRVRSLEVANFQIQTMQIAIEALDKIPASQRDITTLTMSLSAKGFTEVKSILKKARQDILKAAKSDVQEDRVYQVNMQYFPLTKTDIK